MANPTDGSFTQRTILDGVAYNLSFRYNARMDRWILSVADANQNQLLSGICIQGLWPVITTWHNLIAGLFTGDFIAVDLTGQGRDPTELTLGGDIPLFFVDGI